MLPGGAAGSRAIEICSRAVARREVDHPDRVGVGAGDEQAPAVLRQHHRVRMLAHRDLAARRERRRVEEPAPWRRPTARRTASCRPATPGTCSPRPAAPPPGPPCAGLQVHGREELAQRVDGEQPRAVRADGEAAHEALVGRLAERITVAPASSPSSQLASRGPCSLRRPRCRAACRPDARRGRARRSSSAARLVHVSVLQVHHGEARLGVAVVAHHERAGRPGTPPWRAAGRPPRGGARRERSASRWAAA